MTTFIKQTQTDCGFVDVMTTRKTRTVFGYRLVGAKAGPQVVIAGTCPSAADMFGRLISIPSLPWMRGNLVLIRLDALENMLGDVSSLSPLGEIDRTIILPWTDVENLDDVLIRRSYHMVLRVCTELGMIAGRGVARSI